MVRLTRGLLGKLWIEKAVRDFATCFAAPALEAFMVGGQSLHGVQMGMRASAELPRSFRGASAELPRRFRRVRVKLHGKKTSKPGFGTLKPENPTCLLLG